jgi:hypothetical protein
MSRDRTGNVVLEPLPAAALTAREAQEHMKVLEALVTRPGFNKKASVTARCWQNEVMSREYARELFNLVTVTYGVPVLRAVSPTLEGAAHLFDAAADAGRPTAIVVFTEDQGRTGTACKTLEEYARVLGY